MNKNKFLTGTNGRVWVNGKLLAQLKKIEAKVSGSFEEVSTCGSYSTYNVYTGWSGEGTLTLQKTDSEILLMMAGCYESGDMPEIKIITSLTNKSTGKTERVSLSQVDFTEFSLASFEFKGLVEEEIPFKFSEYSVLEAITY